MAKSTPATLALQKAGVAFTLHEYNYDPNADRIGLQAAEALGIEPARLLKTLMARAGDETLCVLAPSDREVKLKKLAQAAGAKSAVMLGAAEAERVTSYHVGGDIAGEIQQRLDWYGRADLRRVRVLIDLEEFPIQRCGRVILGNVDSMSSDFMIWIVLATKMAVTALFVTAATTVAERLGATVGALVATLPVSAGPVYVFLALDHDSAFISASAVASLALNSATAIYLTAYVLIAQRRSMWPSISLAFAIWLVAVLLLSLVDWTAWLAFALNIAVFTACSFIVQPFDAVRIPPTTRRWYDFVLRAGLYPIPESVTLALPGS